MIDTIDIYSSSISYELSEEIKKKSIIRSAKHQIENDVHILYEFAKYEYQKSYSSKIIISVCEEKWEYNEKLKCTEKKKCLPYLRIVGSLHKFFLGTNVYGGSDNIKYQVIYLLNSIEYDLELENQLPLYDYWFVNRIDYAKIYNIGSQQKVIEYFKSLKNVQYPRTKVLYYEGESIYKGGRATSIKLYNKFAEFKKHDYKRWQKMNPDKALNLLSIAEPLIRCEIEIKKSKLQYDYKQTDIYLKQINKEYMEMIYKNEIMRFLNEGEESMKIKNNAQARMVIYNSLSDEMARLVYGFYNDMCINGYKAVKESMPKTTYYRYKSILKSLGINYTNNTIVNTDVINFNPLMYPSYDIDLICDLEQECI